MPKQDDVKMSILLLLVILQKLIQLEVTQANNLEKIVRSFKLNTTS